MEVQHLSFLPLSLVSGMVTLAQMRAVGTHTYVCVRAEEGIRRPAPSRSEPQDRLLAGKP